MIILIETRKRVDRLTFFPYTVFCLGFMVDDVSIATIGEDYLIFEDALKLAKQIERASKGAISVVIEQKEEMYLCPICKEYIEETEWWHYTNEPGSYHTVWFGEPEPRFCGPAQISNLEEEMKPATQERKK